MQEFVDFLARQAPYDRLELADLEELARHVEVEYFAAGAVIVEADGPELEHLFVVRTGLVQVIDRTVTVDELGPGDTFGHISVLSGLPPPLSVVAAIDTLCYRLPDPRPLLASGERLKFAHYNTMVSRARVTNASVDAGMRPVSEIMRPPVWCEADATIRDAACLMTQAGQSCVLVRGHLDDVAIMTDSDCRRRVVTGEVPLDAAVSVIATPSARTVNVTTPVASAFVEMVMHGVHHLVVVDERDQVVGVARVFDLSSAEIRDPLTIRARIDRAVTPADLAQASALLRPTAVELYNAGVPALRVAALLGAMVEAVLEKCVALETTAGLDLSWLVLGSLARREPLPFSDVDTAIVWRALEGTGDEEQRRRAARQAEAVLARVEDCGLRRCPDGANATNPLFCRSLPQWLMSSRRWITEPDREGSLLFAAMVADSRPVTGVALGRTMTDGVEHIATSKRFLKRMLDETLASRPPTGFVRDFVVEDGGTHRGQLDLKKGGLGPVVAIGRWIAVTTRMPVSTTHDRLERGAETELLTRDEADTLRTAHREMFDLLFAREVEAAGAAREATTYLDPRELDSLTRRHLRESFRAIARVQTRLEGEWVSRVRF